MRKSREGSRIALKDQELLKCNYFKYLDSSIIQKDENNEDVNNQIKVGRVKRKGAIGVLFYKNISLKLKRKFWRTIIISAMLYDTECWTVKTQDMSKMNVMEIECFNG